MQNTIKKTLSILLVVLMIFSLNTTVFAAETETLTITVESANAGHQYGAYQIFTGDLQTTDAGEETLSNIIWGAAVTDATSLLTAINTINGFEGCNSAESVADALALAANDSDTAQDFAKVVGNWLKTNNVPATATSGAYAGGSYTISYLQVGYYLVKDDKDLTDTNESATRYILEVVKNVRIEPKAGIPTIEKKVLEDSILTGNDASTKYDSIDPNYNDVADWDIGQTKSFLVSATLPAQMWDYEEYFVQFGDTFDKGITVDEGSYKAMYLNDNNEFVEFTTNPFTANLTQSTSTAGGTLTFICNNIKTALANFEGESVTIAIEYDAMLNENANIGFTGNKNEVDLTFSNDPYSDQKGKTEKDTVIVFTFALNGNKVDGSNDELKLQGAEFVLVKKDASSGELFATVKDGKLIGWATEIGENTTITSDNNGNFTIIGVDSGDYLLRETKAPNGYNMLKDDLQITLVSKKGEDNIYTQEVALNSAIDDLTTTVGTENSGTVRFTIENKKGSILPNTGEAGSVFFYVIGAVGAAFCLIILITKKRMDKYNNNNSK